MCLSVVGARILQGLLAAWLAAAAASPAVAQTAPKSDLTSDPKPDQEEPFTPVNRRVESSDLAPLQLPTDLWRGMEAAAVAKWLAAQDAPPRSPALARLWRRLISSAATPSPRPQGEDNALAHLRLEALYRAGLLGEIREALVKGAGHGAGLGVAAQLWRARIDIGLGAREKGCQALAGPIDPRLSKPLRAEKQLLAGYCAAVAGDTAAAALAASLAREEGSTAELALAILETLDGGVEKRPPLPTRLSLIDYRFLELTGPIDGTQALAKAEPALLVALASSTALAEKVQVAAAYAALRLNVMTPEAVAAVYRRLPAAAKGTDAAAAPVLERALLFRAMEETQAPTARARLIRSFLDGARRGGVLLQSAAMLTTMLSNLWPAPETGPLAEGLVQVALAGGEVELARRWAESAAHLQHWLALVDIADPQARQAQRPALAALDDLAKRGRLPPAVLNRTLSVLDALGLEVPAALWEAAGRLAQPSGGHLPPTGVLAEMAQASQQKEAGRTIILVLQALGPEGPEGANILALADTLRALKRAGLEADARRLAVEALFAAWPRMSAG
jgi:hypothetical protein